MKGQVLDFISPEWEAQYSQIKADLKDYKGEIIELDKLVKNIKLDPGGGAKGIIAQTEQLRKANESARITAEKMNEAFARQEKLSINNAKALEIESKASLNNAKAKKEEAAARDKNAAAILKEFQAAANQAKDTLATQKELERQRKADEKSARDYIRSVKEGAKEMDRLAREQQKLQEQAAKRATSDAERIQRQKNAAAAREEAAANRELAKQAAATERELANQAKEANKLQDAYYRLNKEHQALVRSAQTIGAEFGLESKQFIDAAANANKLGDRLQAIDSSLGNYRRNVGNYGSAYNGLNMSIQQILREAPSAAVSLNTFFLGISNNLPMFFDEINRIIAAQRLALIEGQKAQAAASEQAIASALAAKQTKEQAAAQGKLAAAMAIATPEQLKSAAAARLSAEGSAMAMGANIAQAKAAGDSAAAQALANAQIAKGPGVWKQIMSSLFSVNTLLTAGVLLLTLYGGKIIDFFTGSSEAAREAEKANKKYKESLEQAESTARKASSEDIGRMQLLVAIAKDGEQSTRARTRAIKELQETYPATFGALTKMQIEEGKLNDAVNQTTQALLYRAATQAANGKFQEASDRVYELNDKLRSSYQSLAKASTNYDKALSEMEGKATSVAGAVGQAGMAPSGTDIYLGGLKAKVDAANNSITDLNASLSVAMADQKRYLQDSLNAGKLAGDTLFGKDPKTPKGAKPFDPTNETLSAQEKEDEALARLQKSKIDADMATEKAIYENQKRSIEDRLAAYGKYVDNQQKLYELESSTELKSVRDKLAKIAEVEGKKDPTREEEALLIDKQALQTLEISIEQERANKIIEIRANAEKEVRQILTSSDQYYISTLTKRIQDTEELYDEQYRKDIDALNQSLLKKEINTREYEKRRKELTLKSSQDRLSLEAADLQQQLDMVKLTAEQRAEIEKMLNRILNKSSEDSVEQFKTAEEQKLRIAQEKADSLVSAYQSMYSAIFAIQKGNNEYQNQADDERIKRLEAESQSRINAINAEAISDEEKQKKIQQEELQTEAQRKAIEERQKERNLAMAKAEKQQAIMNIILNTAQAVIKAFTEGDPYTKAFRAAAAGAIGFSQLAAAYAAPLPQYEEGAGPGMGNPAHPGGDFIAGDGGEPELVKEPSGKSYWTDSVARLYSAAAGTTVTPLSKVMDTAHTRAVNQIVNTGKAMTPETYAEAVANQFSVEVDKMTSEIKSLKQVVKNKKEVHFHWSNGQLQKSIDNAGSKTEYVGGMA